MKTAISIPDSLFQAAEAAAKRMGISRSELYSRAVRELLDYREGESVTALLDRLYSDESSSLDPSVVKLQNRVLAKEQW